MESSEQNIAMSMNLCALYLVLCTLCLGSFTIHTNKVPSTKYKVLSL